MFRFFFLILCFYCCCDVWCDELPTKPTFVDRNHEKFEIVFASPTLSSNIRGYQDRQEQEIADRLERVQGLAAQSSKNYANLYDYHYSFLPDWKQDSDCPHGPFKMLETLLSRRKAASRFDWLLLVSGDVIIAEVETSLSKLTRHVPDHVHVIIPSIFEVYNHLPLEKQTLDTHLKSAQFRLNPSIMLVRYSKEAQQFFKTLCSGQQQYLENHHAPMEWYVHFLLTTATQQSQSEQSPLFAAKHGFATYPVFYAPHDFAISFGAEYNFGSEICLRGECVRDMQKMVDNVQARIDHTAKYPYMAAQIRQVWTSYSRNMILQGADSADEQLFSYTPPKKRSTKTKRKKKQTVLNDEQIQQIYI